MLKRLILFLFITLAIGAVFGLSAWRQNQLRQKQAQTDQKAPDETVTIIEGWTIDDIGQFLEKRGIISKTGFYAQLENSDLSAYPLVKARPLNTSLEGYLFPDTYNIPLHINAEVGDTSTSSQVLIKKMLDNFSRKFTKEMEGQAREQNMSIYEILTLASIIEKETGRNAITSEARQRLSEERKIVAGIFYKRLQAGLPLESDATINYVTKKNLPAVTYQDLETKSPYNTYKNVGLPPGPICNPSLSSLVAALNPAQSDYWFFLHKQPSGDVVYSKTFEEHIQNKQKYLK